MTRYDDRILEYLRENNSARPADIARYDYIYCSASYIGQRLRELTEYDLVTAQGRPVYELTEKGRAYLIGAYNAETGQYLHEEDPERGARNYEWVQLQMKDYAKDAKELVDRFSSSE
jgi:predicted transcriptional regulator